MRPKVNIPTSINRFCLLFWFLVAQFVLHLGSLFLFPLYFLFFSSLRVLEVTSRRAAEGISVSPSPVVAASPQPYSIFPKQHSICCQLFPHSWSLWMPSQAPVLNVWKI